MILLIRHIMQDEQLEKVMCIILRLPGLFLLETYYHTALDTEEDIHLLSVPRIAHFLILFTAVLIMTLPLEQLVIFYMHILSAVLLAVAKAYSLHYVITETSPSKAGDEAEPKSYTRNFEALLFHMSVAAGVTSILDLEGKGHRTLLAAYTLPPSARVVGAPVDYLPALHSFASVTIGAWFLGYVLVKLPDLLARFCHLYRVLVFEGRIIYVPVTVWQNYYLMQQMFIFWALLVLVQIYNYFHPEGIGGSPRGLLLLEQEWYLMLLYAVSEVCSSPFSLAASCIAVTYISRFILMFTNVFAQGRLDTTMMDEHPRAGVGEGVTMALLSMQTGMIHLGMPQRVGAMSVVLFIVLGSLVQSMHEITEPLLMRLCASRNISKLRHLRLLFLCIFLLTFPLYMTYFLCSLFKIDFWAIVVVSTCALTSVQVTGSVVVYCLFMFDNLYKDSSWESLDDIVYYARAVTRVLEFLVAVLVVGAGVHESVMMTSDGQPWSWVNSTVLLVHCYYNVYLRLQAGWQSFLLRREASRRVGMLPTATREQLAARAHDVCPVCYIEMTSACVTPCQHLFHASCLRKWLYVQDSCPLCSSHVIESSDSDTPDEEPDVGTGPARQSSRPDENSVPNPADYQQNVLINVGSSREMVPVSVSEAREATEDPSEETEIVVGSGATTQWGEENNNVGDSSDDCDTATSDLQVQGTAEAAAKHPDHENSSSGSLASESVDSAKYSFPCEPVSNSSLKKLGENGAAVTKTFDKNGRMHSVGSFSSASKSMSLETDPIRGTKS